MYVILTNEDNTLSAPKKQRIVQRSKLVDTFWFLVKPEYNGYDMSMTTVLLEYLKPISREYKTEILQLNGQYQEYLKYVLPVDTEFTKEAGSVELQLTFLYADLDVNGNPIQRVRKTAPTFRVEIVPISAWSDIIPDEALSAIDQRIIKMDAQIKALDDMNNSFMDTKADNFVYENDTFQLTANGNKIGNIAKIKSCDNSDEDGVPVVDFNSVVTPDDSTDSEEKDLSNNVVEFA